MTAPGGAVRVQVLDDSGEWVTPPQQTPAVLAALTAIGGDIEGYSGSYETRDLQRIREGLHDLDARVARRLDPRQQRAAGGPLPPHVHEALARADREAHALQLVRDAGEDDDAAEGHLLDALTVLADAVRGERPAPASEEGHLAAAIEAITGTDADTAEGLAAEVLWILGRIIREAAGEPPPRFAGGQPVEFRDRTMTATWQPATFVRQEGTVAVVDGPGGLRYLTDIDRVRVPAGRPDRPAVLAAGDVTFAGGRHAAGLDDWKF